ncbi:MAG: tRNA (adenosine(37)-N6)-dimethylallyltransferase MiaA [Ruminococcaceae bacterium]|nr:tRNA (adenosine(37)-N6)-dimethylallyltransferase MiaA [Oscillospiraceae bacterium]
MQKIKTISVAGPTASGKTALSVELARRLDGEIVSFDSMQLYRGMNIGTATPDMTERGGIPHHMFDICEPEDSFSAADYAAAAAPVITDIASRGKAVILCGGTGMYLDSLMKISSYKEGKSNEGLRKELAEYAEKNGNEALHQKLREIDSESAEKIHPNNVKRVIRAIEIYRLTGMTKTQVDAEQVTGECAYDNTNVIIDYRNRDILYDRINRRVDLMLRDGLIEEARTLYDSGRLGGKTASQAIGYKELVPYFEGKCTLIEAAEQIKLNTRHYAKRQITWFNRYDGIRLAPDEGEVLRTASELADAVVEAIS